MGRALCFPHPHSLFSAWTPLAFCSRATTKFAFIGAQQLCQILPPSFDTEGGKPANRQYPCGSQKTRPLWRHTGDINCLCAPLPYLVAARAGIPAEAPMDSLGWHPRRSCPTGYGSGLPVSLPDFRKLSGPHPIAKPLTGFAHLRTEKIRAKNRRKKWIGRPTIPRLCSAMALQKAAKHYLKSADFIHCGNGLKEFEIALGRTKCIEVALCPSHRVIRIPQ